MLLWSFLDCLPRLYLDSLPPNLISLEAQNAVVVLNDPAVAAVAGPSTAMRRQGGSSPWTPPRAVPTIIPLQGAAALGSPMSPAAPPVAISSGHSSLRPLESRLGNIGIMKGKSALCDLMAFHIVSCPGLLYLKYCHFCQPPNVWPSGFSACLIPVIRL